MRRVGDNKYGYSTWSDDDIKRWVRIGVMLLLAVVLAVVLFAVNKKKQAEQPADGVTAESTLPEEEQKAGENTDAESTSEAVETQPESHDFGVNEVPEVTDLMNRYFTAKQNADAESIYQLFGWSDQAGLDSLKRQLQYDARYTDGYRNVVCYTKPGVAEGSYLVYVSYDLKFKDSLTLAPGLLWNYVKQGEDGNWYLTDAETLDDVELAFIAESEKADEIVLLKTEIYARLREALESDVQLAEGYAILEKQGGAAGAKQEETKHEAEVQIGN